jgi:FkbM family methyltransferase
MPVRKRLKPVILRTLPTFFGRLGFGFFELSGLLKQLNSNGFCPRTIVDVGAYVGNWTRVATGVFPSAGVIMIEANADNRARLAKAAADVGNCEFIIALLGPEQKADVIFHVGDEGSSVLPELTSFAMQERCVPMMRLDDLMSSRSAPTPILLKLDVQGFELEVLRGAAQTLVASEVVILETALLPYNQGAPIFADVISFMTTAGFAVYDFCGEHRRESDNALFQTDVVFVKTNSQLRARRKFWLHEL